MITKSKSLLIRRDASDKLIMSRIDIEHGVSINCFEVELHFDYEGEKEEKMMVKIDS